MVDSPEGLRPGADLQGWFGSQLEGIELASNISMSTLDPLIDSSEATPEDWQAIIDDINAHADEADAFLVLHGTDTMAYSAAALSYALASMGKPVVLTGSQYPLGVVVVLMVAGWYYVRGRVGNLTDEAAASLQGEETLVAGD